MRGHRGVQPRLPGTDASWAIGLTSVPWRSGSVDHDQGIVKAGPSMVRKHLIRMAWRWLRFQPGSCLAQWCCERAGEGRQNRKRLIVALARQLLVVLWRLATHWVVPEGAVVR